MSLKLPSLWAAVDMAHVIYKSIHMFFVCSLKYDTFRGFQGGMWDTDSKNIANVIVKLPFMNKEQCCCWKETQDMISSLWCNSHCFGSFFSIIPSFSLIHFFTSQFLQFSHHHLWLEFRNIFYLLGLGLKMTKCFGRSWFVATCNFLKGYLQ